MSKKKKDAILSEAEQAIAARLNAIKDYNRENMGKSWIDPERTPTEEEVEAAKTEFESRAKALQDKKDYLIADKENALRVAKFMKEFIENGFWTQRFFVGVTNFSALIDTFIKECEEDPKDLVLEYGPLQFAFLMFENYAGVGLSAAKHMAEIWNEYVPIYDTLRGHVEYYNKEAKEIDKCKQKWGFMSQGYYFVWLDSDESSTEGAQSNSTDVIEDSSTGETLDPDAVVTGE